MKTVLTLHRRACSARRLAHVARQLLVQRIHGLVAVDVDRVVAHAAVARDIGADDVVVQHGLDHLVFLLRLGGLQRAADEALLFAGERHEDQRLVEFVLAHHARQFHDGGGAAAVVANAGRGQFGVLFEIRQASCWRGVAAAAPAPSPRRSRPAPRPPGACRDSANRSVPLTMTTCVSGIFVPGQYGDHVLQIDIFENALSLLLHAELFELHLQFRTVALASP